MNTRKIKFNKVFQWNLDDGGLWWGNGLEENSLSFSFSTTELREKFLTKVDGDKEYINCQDDVKKYKMTRYEKEEGKDSLRTKYGNIDVDSVNFFFEEIKEK